MFGYWYSSNSNAHPILWTRALNTSFSSLAIMTEHSIVNMIARYIWSLKTYGFWFLLDTGICFCVQHLHNLKLFLSASRVLIHYQTHILCKARPLPVITRKNPTRNGKDRIPPGWYLILGLPWPGWATHEKALEPWHRRAVHIPNLAPGYHAPAVHLRRNIGLNLYQVQWAD